MFRFTTLPSVEDQADHVLGRLVPCTSLEPPCDRVAFANWLEPMNFTLLVRLDPREAMGIGLVLEVARKIKTAGSGIRQVFVFGNAVHMVANNLAKKTIDDLTALNEMAESDGFPIVLCTSALTRRNMKMSGALSQFQRGSIGQWLMALATSKSIEVNESTLPSDVDEMEWAVNRAPESTLHVVLVLQSGDRDYTLESIDLGLGALAFEHRLTVVLRDAALPWANCHIDTGKPILPPLRALHHHGATLFACVDGIDASQAVSCRPQRNATDRTIHQARIEELSDITTQQLEERLKQADVVIHG